MGGHAGEAEMAAFLIALRMKGESAVEISSFARVMREYATRINPNVEGTLVDVCGTGGDGAHTFNVSTAAMFVVAAAGVPVAKHGNRSFTSKCGSADVLESLGAKIDIRPERIEACIEEVGLGFMFAPTHHAAMRHVAKVRTELGTRTIFNLLGPLTNPAGATHQLIGVYDPELTHTLAEVLGALGGRAAFVVHGHSGLDELTTSGANRVSHLKDGRVHTFDLDPTGLGLRPAGPGDLNGGEPAQNARMLRAILSGEDRSPRRDVVLLNAAAALTTEHGDLVEGLHEAERSLESGAALAKLNGLITLSQALAAGRDGLSTEADRR